MLDQDLEGVLTEYREPGVLDLALPSVTYTQATTTTNRAVSLLSERGLVANITLGVPTDPRLAELHASSHGQEGTPLDMEIQRVGSSEYLVAVYTGDEKGLSLRFFDAATLATVREVTNIVAPNEEGKSRATDLAAVHYQTDNGDPGDHLLLLHRDWLYLFDQNGVLIGKKELASYLPATQSHAIAVGDLVSELPAGGTYDDEVVIATFPGRLVWFHVDEILGTMTTALPASVSLTAGVAVQPRTNQALACTWPIAYAPEPNRLEVLEQNGMMWEVTPGGAPALKKSDILAAGPNRRWVKTGLPAFVDPVAFTKVRLQPLSSTEGAVQTTRYCPIKTGEARFQQTPYFLSTNWNERDHNLRFLDGYAIFCRAGDTRDLSGGHAAYWWSGSTTGRPGPPDEREWANFVEGIHIDGGGTITGAWASTDSSLDANSNADYLDLRTVVIGLASMDLQSVRVVERPGTPGQDVLILGCPGGRVRIVQPGSLAEPHGLGSELAFSDDYGHGGAALAVRPTAQYVDIFFGTLYHHVPRGGYPYSSGGPLADSEVQTGSIHWLRWDPASEALLSHVSTLELPPVAGSDRGGFGVLGLAVEELLTDPAHSGEELIATTIEGDLYVLDIQGGTINPTPIYRSHVPGGLGLYNSIVVANLDGVNPGPELYLAGSMGIRKFFAPGNQ